MKFALCSSRHPMPVEMPSIFPETVTDPTDIDALMGIVDAKLSELNAGKAFALEPIDLYVTGLTVCVGAVVRYCYLHMVPCTLHHFDRTTGDYYPQVIISVQDAAFQRERGWY